jgi:hypothetical protein
MNSVSINLLIENLGFWAIATSLLLVGGWMWRNSKPFNIPQPLPAWFPFWLRTVLVVGIILPLLALVWWGIIESSQGVLQALIPYFIMLFLQIISEIVTLRRFHSCIWIAIPCLYLPYRLWQLHQGLNLISNDSKTVWMQWLLIIEMVLWIFNYGVHLSQIPRLLQWDKQENGNLPDSR